MYKQANHRWSGARGGQKRAISMGLPSQCWCHVDNDIDHIASSTHLQDKVEKELIEMKCPICKITESPFWWDIPMAKIRHLNIPSQIDITMDLIAQGNKSETSITEEEMDGSDNSVKLCHICYWKLHKVENGDPVKSPEDLMCSL